MATAGFNANGDALPAEYSYRPANPIPPWDWRKSESERRQKSRSDMDTGYWLNTSTGVRHNASCPNYRNTKRGRPCGADEGRACGMCGG